MIAWVCFILSDEVGDELGDGMGDGVGCCEFSYEVGWY